MHGGNNIREVALQIINVGNRLIHILLYLLNNLIKLIVIYREVILEHSNGLFASFSENGGDLINKVDFGYEHPGEEWSN
jgi:hypothetical protein